MSKIPVNEFPKYLHNAANKVDIDGDGAISAEEIAVMIEDMNHAKKLNQTLSRAMIVFGVLCVLLVGSTFGASIAAARLSKDFVVDPSTGFASAKGSGSVMKTTEALEEIELSIADLSMEELMNLHGITIENMHFDIKGYARDSLTDVTHLIIEGGFLQFNQSGLVGASAPIFDVIGLPMTEVDTDGRKLGEKDVAVKVQSKITSAGAYGEAKSESKKEVESSKGGTEAVPSAKQASSKDKELQKEKSY